MTNVRVILLSLLAVVALAGCHRGDDISVDGHSIVLHPSGVTNATVTSSGSFSVGNTEIAVPPAQRSLFTQYFNEVVAVHRDRDAIKNAGMAMAGQAMHAVGDSVKNALGHASSSAKAADKAMQANMQASGKRMEIQANMLCLEVRLVSATQKALAAQVDAFKPYADINPAAHVNCGSLLKTSSN